MDFFTPVVDDPWCFGQITLLMYAMGAEPKLVMNVVCFLQNIDMDILGEISSEPIGTRSRG